MVVLSGINIPCKNQSSSNLTARLNSRCHLALFSVGLIMACSGLIC
uniref:Uncharacterized protein n=1 Tax=Arundo donax TaxID=35708 RepID=A0A0A9BII8_ARUDO